MVPLPKAAGVSDSDAFRDSLAALSRFFVGDASVEQTLQRVLEEVPAVLPTTAYAGLTMLVEDKVETAVFTDPDVPEIDQAQYDTGKGPCLDAYRHGQTYVIPSTERDDRWPEFSAACLEHGIRSTLSLPLHVGERPIGALNLYADTDDAFSDDDVSVGSRFAAQAAAVLANAQAYWDARMLSENLAEAMKSRATIEQAKGILMAQKPMTPDQAYDVLRMASQRENRKLREIARELVERHGGRRDGDGST